MLHNDKTWTIRMIEALTEAEARALAVEAMTIKDHAVYFVEFKGHFGFSALVYRDGRHIYHANEYELYYANKSRDELRALFIENLEGKLFTDAEITAPVADYDEYRRKSRFVHSYFPMRTDHVSIFGCARTDAEVRAYRERIAGMTYDPVALAYVADPDFVRRHVELNSELEAAWTARQNDFDALVSAFVYEMSNHEYAINWQGNWDVLSCWGNIEYDEQDRPEAYFDQLHFTPKQRAAYWQARRDYMAAHSDC